MMITHKLLLKKTSLRCAKKKAKTSFFDSLEDPTTTELEEEKKRTFQKFPYFCSLPKTKRKENDTDK